MGFNAECADRRESLGARNTVHVLVIMSGAISVSKRRNHTSLFETGYYKLD